MCSRPFGPALVAGLALLLASAALASATASAQPEDAAPPAVSPRVEPPPTPDQLEPELLVAVSLGAVAPLERNDICPGDSRCVLGAGGAFKVDIERRWPIGVGVAVGYDAWFVDSGGVFELGVVQMIYAAVRYTFLQELELHPSIHLGAGALVFGDTFLPSTVGGAAEAGANLELELTAVVALTLGAQLWLFTTSPFTTGRDRTMRSEGLGLNAALQVNLGLSILAEAGGG